MGIGTSPEQPQPQALSSEQESRLADALRKFYHRSKTAPGYYELQLSAVLTHAEIPPELKNAVLAVLADAPGVSVAYDRVVFDSTSFYIGDPLHGRPRTSEDPILPDEEIVRKAKEGGLGGKKV